MPEEGGFFSAASLEPSAVTVKAKPKHRKKKKVTLVYKKDADADKDGAPEEGETGLEFQVKTHVFKATTKKKKRHKHHRHKHREKEGHSGSGGRRPSQGRRHSKSSKSTSPSSGSAKDGAAEPAHARPGAETAVVTSESKPQTATDAGETAQTKAIAIDDGAEDRPEANVADNESGSDYDDDQFIKMFTQTAPAAGIDKMLSDDDSEDDDGGKAVEAELLKDVSTPVSDSAKARTNDDTARPLAAAAFTPDVLQRLVETSTEDPDTPKGEDDTHGSTLTMQQRARSTFPKGVTDIADLEMSTVDMSSNWELRVERQRRLRMRSQFLEKRNRVNRELQHLRAALGPRASSAMMDAYEHAPPSKAGAAGESMRAPTEARSNTVATANSIAAGRPSHEGFVNARESLRRKIEAAQRALDSTVHEAAAGEPLSSK